MVAFKYVNIFMASTLKPKPMDRLKY